MRNCIIILIGIFSFTLNAQETKEVLFIGNSYTGFNQLGQIVADIALSNGDTLIFQTHTPGGNTMANHANNATALSLIASNDWDFVSLQAQSQEPSFPIGQVQNDVFPFAEILCDSIRSSNSCSVPLFFMTWGRENGDQSNCANYPPLCPYEGMDSLLQARYLIMAEDNKAKVSPVAKVWRYIRENHPTIDLYNADGSHPSPTGSYAAACAFYTMIFQKDVTTATFNGSLSGTDAQTIKETAKLIVFDALTEFDFTALAPTADFTINVLNEDGNEIEIENFSTNTSSYLWDLGDGTESTVENIDLYTYPQPINENVTYTISLVAENCGLTDTLTSSITIDSVSDLFDGNPEQSVGSFFDARNESIGCACNQNFNEFFLQINLYDKKGNLIITKENLGRNANIDARHLSRQIYILEMITNKGRYIEKVPVF